MALMSLLILRIWWRGFAAVHIVCDRGSGLSGVCGCCKLVVFMAAIYRIYRVPGGSLRFDCIVDIYVSCLEASLRRKSHYSCHGSGAVQRP